ncbi:MAG: Hsp70 family protein [Anaerolineae bacterium]|nr:Hsp70 family protein [Anaerolineae bacterium]
MKLGLDFGTTNCSAALYDGAELNVIRSPFSEPTGILPSLIYITRTYEHLLGKPAARRYLDEDTGRPAVWETKHAGTIDYWVSIDLPSSLGGRVEPVLVKHDVFVQEDIGAHGRLLQSIKTALRNPNYAGTSIFGRMYTIEQLITLMLADLRVAAQQTTGGAIDAVMIGRPVRFTGSLRDDMRAEAILRQAARAAGFSEITFMLEPIAAAYSYHISQSQRHTALIFDFGGGTLDLTVAQIGGTQPPQVLATEGLLIGGNNFDQRIMEKFLWPHFGYNKPHEGNRKLSYEVYDYLLDWARHPDLTRHEHYREIKRAATVNKAGPEFEALYKLINNNYGYQLFETIEQAKIALSSQEAVTLSFKVEGITIEQRITRQSFKRAIQDYLNEIDVAVAQVVAQASLEDQDIDLVICTGGSSSIPAIMDLLADRFGRDRLRPHNPFLSVSSGLAVAAHSNGHASGR